MENLRNVPLLKVDKYKQERSYIADNLSFSWFPVGGADGMKFRIRLENPLNRSYFSRHKPLYFFAKHYELGSSNWNLRVLKKIYAVSNNYRRLFARGFLVPKTFRLVRGKKEMYFVMSDLTEGDNYWLWGHNDNSNPHELGTLGAMRLTNQDLKTINYIVRVTGYRAGKERLAIEFHNYHLRKHKKTGQISIPILDIAQDIGSPGECAQLNLKEADRFMRRLYNTLRLTQ